MAVGDDTMRLKDFDNVESTNIDFKEFFCKLSLITFLLKFYLTYLILIIG